MEKQRKQARTAGLLYLALVVLGILNLIVIPRQYVVGGDPAATITNIQEMQPVFRMGIIVGVLSDTVYILLAFAFYRLLAPVGRPAATLLVVFAAAGAGLGLVSAGARLDVLTVLDGAAHLQAFTAEQLQAQAILSLRSYSNMLRVAELFWGLWLFPLGLLVYRSRFLPRALGVLLMGGELRLRDQLLRERSVACLRDDVAPDADPAAGPHRGDRNHAVAGHRGNDPPEGGAAVVAPRAPRAPRAMSATIQAGRMSRLLPGAARPMTRPSRMHLP